MNWQRFSRYMWLPLILIVLFSGVGYAAPYVPPAPLATPDYFGYANYANSPLPVGTVATVTLTAGGSGYTSPIVTIADFNCTVGCGSGAAASATVTAGVITGITLTSGGSGYFAPVVTITDATGKGAAAAAVIGSPMVGTGMRKFVDNMPGLCPVSGQNGLGQCIPVASPDTTTFTGSDYYRLGVLDYTQKMHTDLPATKLRGYVQLNAAGTPVVLTGAANAHQYLGPLIIATKNRPVRIKFVNQLGIGTAGDLFIPVDTTYMGAGKGPDGTSWYTQNRATLHLHGGATPWISDGTPHQWVTPANDTTATYLKGASFYNVPDMVNGSGTACIGGAECFTPALNDGIATYFWTNEQGDRLMFYHDHAYGTTRLDVYAGEAAGYLLVDPVEESALAAATAPGTIPNPSTLVGADLSHLIPLVIQDKTFVPPAAQLSAEDPTWSTTLYSGTGGLWFPHVYTPNQNPTSTAITGGANAFGRWDYGPWFFPPQTSLTAANPPTAVTVPCTSIAYPGLQLQCPITPNPSGTPEAFMDTPVVNGTAYPVLHVAPAAYRFRILIAGNDRSWNLSLFTAVTASGAPCTDPHGVGCTEVKMLPAVIPAAGTPWPACATVTQIANPALNAGLATAALDAVGNPLNSTGLPANCWPSTWPTDARVGGVPDPTTAGPPWIQIGTEGGLLPAPVVIPATPVSYERNPRSITVTNVGIHGLLIGPAERADVIVDFSAFAGKTLILYNDSPAPIPGFDARIDYFTGAPDQTTSGGAPTTLPGYGPNTRTVMQIVVDQTAPNTTPFNLNTLTAAFNTTTTAPTAPNGIYAKTQAAPIVPESAYDAAFNVAYTDKYTAIQDTTITYTPLGANNLPAAVPTLANLESKAIQELFTLDYGRMNATLGVELPRTNFTIQTTVPLGYIDPPTETFTDGETQIWKLTHNGVDTHFIHFHLFNVQVINRMGWDGSIRPPDPNELGWKETVRMNPLEDITFALKPIKPSVPFPVPNSFRFWDVTQPLGGLMNFTNIDPLTGNPIVTTNTSQNFGWEYVWHCHILGHEENDMMRPMIFQVPTVVPPAPTLLAPTTAAQNVTLTWTEPATTPDNGLVGFTIWRNGANIATITSTSIRSYADTTVASNTAYSYQVIAYNGIGNSAGSNIQNITSATFVAPTVAITAPTNGASFNLGVTIPLTANATPNGTGVTITKVEFYSGTTLIGTVLTAPYTFNWTGVPAGTYSVTAKAYDSQGATAVSAPISVTVLNVVSPVSGVGITSITPASPSAAGSNVTFNALATGGSGAYQYQFWVRNPVTLTWTSTAYSTTSSWVWNTSGLPAGTYNVQVWARNVGSAAAYEAYAATTYTLTAATPATSVSFTSVTPASPQLNGTSITLNVAAAGGSGPYEYQFWVLNPVAGTWSNTAYSTASSMIWNTAGLSAGTYTIQVWARNVGSTAAYEAYAATIYTLRVAPATSVRLLSITPASPQLAGTSVTFSASAAGGAGPYEYQLWVLNPVTLTWTSTAYSATSSLVWNTTGLPAGTYNVQVWARNVGSTAAYEAYTTATYVLQ